MNENIVNLMTANVPVMPVDQSVIDYLREMLKRAEAGEIQGVAIVTVESNGAGTVISCGAGWMGEGMYQNTHAAIGAVSHLHHRMLGMLDAQ